MNPPSETAVLARAALLILAPAFCLLGIFTSVILIRNLIIFPRFRKEFLELHNRRVARVRLALVDEKQKEQAETVSSHLTAAHSFSEFLTLGEDGTVTIGGKSFRPGETFAITACDENGTPRVKTAGTGHEVLITSHGQNFRATFNTGKWSVQLLEDVKS